MTNTRDDPPYDRRIPDLVGLQEAAKIMRVSKQAALKMVRKSQLKGRRLGESSTWVFLKTEVEAMPKHGTGPTPAADS